VQVSFLRGGSAAILATWSQPVKGSTILLQLCLLRLESADTFATWSRQVGESATLLQLCLLPVESAVAFFDMWSRPTPEVATKLFKIRVRSGSDSSASACCKAGPSSNFGSAPQRRPSAERKLWGKQEQHSTTYRYKNIVSMPDLCEINKKECQRGTRCHQIFKTFQNSYFNFQVS
jgi:hypothetical protein